MVTTDQILSYLPKHVLSFNFYALNIMISDTFEFDTNIFHSFDHLYYYYFHSFDHKKMTVPINISLLTLHIGSKLQKFRVQLL